MADQRTYPDGFAHGRQQGAASLLEIQADGLQAASARLAEWPAATAALNEATAILRDAATDLDPAAGDGHIAITAAANGAA